MRPAMTAPPRFISLTPGQQLSLFARRGEQLLCVEGSVDLTGPAQLLGDVPFTPRLRLTPGEPLRLAGGWLSLQATGPVELWWLAPQPRRWQTWWAARRPKARGTVLVAG